MNPTLSVPTSHQKTYERIFKYPALNNLEWRDVRALLTEICQSEEKPNGSIRFTRHGETLVLRPSLTKEVNDIDELNALRDFLIHTENAPADAGAPSDHWLLVIDHHQARIFTNDRNGAIPLQILPPPTSDHFRHSLDSEDFSHSREPHGQSAFFVKVAQALKAAPHVLVFGYGTGKSCCMQQFHDWVKHHHPDLAGRIRGTVTVDERHLTDDQLLAEMRAFFSHPHVA